MCQRLPLTSFLILPFQRVTRLKMLVEVARFRKGREGEPGLHPLVYHLLSLCFCCYIVFFLPLLAYDNYA